MSKKLSTREKVLLGLTIISVTISCICFVNKNNVQLKQEDITPPNVENKLNSNIYITAAHLGEIEGYKLLLEEEERDIAYYIKDTVELTTLKEQEVNIEGLEGCKIVKAEPGVFYVTTTTPERIINGMSGTRVFDKNGQPLGFVDALVKNMQIKCITLE